MTDLPAKAPKTDMPPLWAWLILAVGFVSTQRILLSPVNAYVCLIPLLLALANWRRPSVRNTLIVVALLAKVDLGGNENDIAYAETASAARVAIVAAAASLLAGRVAASATRYLCVFLLVGAVAMATLLNAAAIDQYTLVRDLVTGALIVTILLVKGRPDVDAIDMRAFAYYGAGVLSSELINICFVFDKAQGQYLSYDSLKCVVTGVSLWLLLIGRRALAALAAAATLIVLVEYSSRALLISYAVVFSAMYFLTLAKVRLRSVVAPIGLGAIAVAAIAASEFSLESNRVFSVILNVENASDFAGYFRLLDPVRYAEHELFFERGAPRVIVGDGLGAGLIDSKGALAFVQYESGAFSDEEIDSGRFYRLHDSWIYIGLRFGLLVVVLVNWHFVRSLWSRSPRRVMAGALGLLMLNNAAFSVAGLIMTALLARQVTLKGQAGPGESGPGLA